MPSIVVAIPTFQRPEGLERLLKALAALETDREIAVLVADNDAAAQRGAELCARVVSEGYRWPLKTMIVPERGIAQVRNALVDAALSDPEMRFVAMLDDDEWPDEHWLTELMRVQETTGAEVVRGAVHMVFETPPPRWAANWEGISSIRSAPDDDSPVEGTGNVLIARRCFEALSKPHFDPQFGLTGGEDRDFFVRLTALGMRFARAAGAIVFEYVPAQRTRLKWSLMRAYRTGNSDMRIALKYQRNPAGIAKEVAKIGAALISAPVLFVAFSLTPTRRLDGLQKLCRAAGKIGALFGHRHYEYSAPRTR